MRLPIAVIIVACFSQAAEAAIMSKNTEFITVCADSKVTGLAWQSGAWVTTDFPLQRRMVEKVFTITDAVCDYEMQSKQPEYQDMLDADPTSSLGCYNIRDYGTNYNTLNTQVCFEKWSDAGALMRIDCSDSYEAMSLSPDGDFNRSNIAGATSDTSPGAARMPLRVATGTCIVSSQR